MVEARTKRLPACDELVTEQYILESKTQQEQHELYCAQTIPLPCRLSQTNEEGDVDNGEFCTIGQELGEEWLSRKQRFQLNMYQAQCAWDETIPSEAHAGHVETEEAADQRTIPEGTHPHVEERRGFRPFHADPMRMMAAVPSRPSDVMSDYGRRDMMMRDLSEDSRSYSHESSDLSDREIRDLNITILSSSGSGSGSDSTRAEHDERRDMEIGNVLLREQQEQEVEQVRTGVSGESMHGRKKKKKKIRRRDILKKHLVVAKYRMRRTKMEAGHRGKMKRRIQVLFSEVKSSRRELKERKAINTISNNRDSGFDFTWQQ